MPIDGGKLPVFNEFLGSHDLVDGLAGGQTGSETVKDQRAQIRIRNVLCRDSADAGTHVRASGAHGD
jgi:hypothetical protein